MRYFWICSVVLLVGCAEPSPAEMQLQAACDAGNLDACEVIVASEDARRQAASRFLMSYGAQMRSRQQPALIYELPAQAAPRQQMTTTNCSALGGFLHCTTW